MTAAKNSLSTTLGLRTVGRLQSTYGELVSGILPSGALAINTTKYLCIAFKAPSDCQILINGALSDNGPWPANTYSLFRPWDRIEGKFEADTHCDVLSLCPTRLNTFIDAEFATEPNAVLDNCLGQDMSLVTQNIWHRLRTCIASDQPQVNIDIDFCIELLITSFVEQRRAVSNTLGAGGNVNAVRQAANHINKNLASTLDLKTISTVAGLSPFYFSRVFKAAYGVTVHRFVLERRLELASRLLIQNEGSISSIALDAGFSSQSHMTTAFRLRYGVTPLAFRQLSPRDISPD